MIASNKICERMKAWIKDQMGLSGQSSQVYRHVYGEDISDEGIEFQIRTFYELTDNVRRRRLKILLEQLSPRYDDFILDVGCGVGTFASYSAKEGARAIGIDYSISAAKTAKHLSGKYSTPRTPFFIVADATKLPFKQEVFNKVICADFFEHVSDIEKEKVLREIMRVVNSGQIIIYTPNLIREIIGYLYNYTKSIFTRNKVSVNHRHFGLTTRTKFEKMMSNFDSISITFKYIDEMRPYMEKIPLLRRFLALNLLWKIGKN